MLRNVYKFLVISSLVLLGMKSSYGATFTVTMINNNDYGCGGTPNGTNTAIPACVGYAGSLGWAIASANANPGADIIDFNLPSGSTITVANPAWLLINDAVTIDATINSMAAAWAVAGSCNPIIELSYGFSAGLDIRVAGCTVKGLIINTGGNAISFSSIAVTSGNVQGCWTGLNQTGIALGTVPQQGVNINTGASGIIIGGNSCALRNVFLANNDGGVYFNNGDNCTVIGNYFNTRYDGTAHLDPGGGQACIRMVAGSTGNIIGTNAAGEGNVFTTSDGQAAIFLEAASNNNTIRNAIIGFAANGTTGAPAALASYPDHGIRADACSGGTIDNCVIGGFNRFGINLDGANPNNWTITNSKIGTDATGNVARRNEEGGIFVNTAASGIVITGNIVSGNGTAGSVGPGMQFENGCVSCNVQNNRIGIAANNTCLGNSGSGIFIKNTNSALTFLQDNSSGCNGYGNLGGQLHGIHMLACSNLNVLNNYLGTTAANVQLGNNQDGVSMNGCSSILCQGNTSRYNNWGIFMQAAGGGNILIGNTITGNGFNNTPLVKSILNEGGGICIQTSNNGNFIR